jgi:predicted GNAT family N-acyltransferase
VSHSQPAYRIEPLRREHNRAAFSCGVAALDRYLREQATQDARNYAAAPFVLVTPENRIAGYYTLSSAIIVAEHLSPDIAKQHKWPRYPELPATLIGRLASDRAFRGKRIGELLLMDALKRVCQSDIASLAVLVDAKDDAARQFYLKYGFLSFPDRQNRLFLPRKTFEKLFAPRRSYRLFHIT